MRPILLAMSTYNYALAKSLGNKLKPLSLNHHAVTNIFDFINEVQDLRISDGNILVSYDVSSKFTNVPLDETIVILIEKAFRDNWFNSAYNLNIYEERTLLTSWVWLRKINRSSSMVPSMSKSMEWLWGPPLGHC